MADSPLSSPAPDGEPPRKQQKRSYVACLRCHGHKVKCSGGDPCQRCQKAKANCDYPPRDNKTVGSQRRSKQPRISELEPGSRRLDMVDPDLPVERREGSPFPPTRSSVAAYQQENEHRQDTMIAEGMDAFQQEQASLQELHVESTCLAFGERFLHCLSATSASPVPPDRQYYRSAVFERQTTTAASRKLPDRVRAILLVRVALRFIGQDYHLFLRDEFLQQLDRAYSSKNGGRNLDTSWACKFFVVLALGELYSTSSTMSANRMGDPGAVSGVPGTAFYETAVSLLQDLYEEPTTSQVEIMLLFCFYSNALGRTKSAHIYSGLALRLSTCLGLHRRCKGQDSSMSAIEQDQHFIRLFWTCYIFDRSTSSRLGVPMSIQDTDIDVQMPSVVASEKLAPPDHLVANIELSRITGCIMRDIYGPSNKANLGKSLFQGIRANLQKLRQWDANLPTGLRLNQSTSLQRPAASLHLHFNQCIILTTRPVLLYVLKAKNPFENVAGTSHALAQVSDTANMLAESCIIAARTSSSVLSQLYTENALATYGYFDAHHLFSSALILIMSAILSPNSSDSDAVQTTFHLLKIMRDCGNTIAMDYYSCLTNIQSTIGRLRAEALAARRSATIVDTSTTTNNGLPDNLSLETCNTENYGWDISMLLDSNLTDLDNLDTFDGNITNPLALLQTFLNGHNSWDPNTSFRME